MRVLGVLTIVAAHFVRSVAIVGEIIVESVEQAVPQPGADEGSEKQGVEKRIKQVLVQFLPLEELREHPVAQDETRDKQEPVPPYGEAPDPEYLRIHVPVHYQRIHGLQNITPG